jgi:large subunit ribosomal protein L4
MMASLTVLDAKGNQSGTLELKPDVFGEVNVPVLHQAVVRELADRRVGTHDTKGRSEVSGGGKKPWKQKGTGRARQGSIRATQWKGGGKPFGPTPRSYDKAMPREMRRQALRSAVAARVSAGEVIVVDSLGAADGKTKSLVTQLAGFGVKAGTRALVVVREGSEALVRGARNVSWLSVETPGHVSAYQLVQARQVLFERGALVALEEALSR